MGGPRGVECVSFSVRNSTGVWKYCVGSWREETSEMRIGTTGLCEVQSPDHRVIDKRDGLCTYRKIKVNCERVHET